MNRDQRSIHDALTRDQDALRSDMEAIGRDFRKALDEATARELAAINAHHDRLTREVCADDCTVTVKVEQDEPAESSPLLAPIDLSWVTTEPVYEGPRWLHWMLLAAKFGLLLMLAAIAAAVILK